MVSFYQIDITRKKEKSEKIFFLYELNKHISDPKKLWETMRLILPPSKKQSAFSEQPNKLNVEGKTIQNSFDITEIFNNYFVKVCKTFAEEIQPTPPQTFKKYLRNGI